LHFLAVICKRYTGRALYGEKALAFSKILCYNNSSDFLPVEKPKKQKVRDAA
jgi:hypothetical protein